MDAGKAITAFMLGVAGAILIISGIRDVHPAVTLQQLLMTGTMPAKGAKKATAKAVGAAPKPAGAAPKPAGASAITQYSSPIGPGLPNSPEGGGGPPRTQL